MPTELIELKCFSHIEDPRKNNSRHLLSEILFIACCAVICGAESWDDIELYGKSKLEWLQTFLSLPHGIPSDDTFRRIFSALNPSTFEESFRNWIKTLVSNVQGDIIPIDGKRLRGAFRASGSNVIHQVSAWSCKYQLVLGQVKTEDKSNEITAIPELLKLLDIKGAVITIDAMGTQKEITGQVVKQEGDYVLALKGNHSILHKDVIDYFDDLQHPHTAACAASVHETVDKGHGRLEIRQCEVVTDLEWLEERSQWAGLSALIKVQSVTEQLKTGHVSSETRYYISSLSHSAEDFLEIIRAHWQIENNLHWVLDVSFSEDASLIHTPNAAENFSLLRKIALILLKKDETQGSLKSKRKRAGWDNQFLLSLLEHLNPK